MKNADLLDESVANSGSLKSRRINQIAAKAVNPNPNPTNQNVSEEIEEEEMENTGAAQNEQRNYTKPNYSASSSNTKKSSNNNDDEKKILGMKPVLFYTLLGVAVFIGGAIIYSKMSGKKVKKPIGGGASDAVKGGASEAVKGAAEAATSTAQAASVAAMP